MNVDLANTRGAASNRAHRVGRREVWVAAGSCGGMLGEFCRGESRWTGRHPPVGPRALRGGSRTVGHATWGDSARSGRIGGHVHGHNDGRDERVRSGGGIERQRRAEGKRTGLLADQGDPVQWVRVPPPLALLWVEQMELEERWLWPVLEPGQPSAMRFVFRGVGGKPVKGMTAFCSSDTHCELDAAGVPSSNSGPSRVSGERLMQYATGAV